MYIPETWVYIIDVGNSDEIPIQNDKGNYDLLPIDPRRKLIMSVMIIFVMVTAVTIGGWLLIAAISTMSGTNNSYSKYWMFSLSNWF